MKIQTQDTYHGTALMQIVEHKTFKALNKADEQYGHYLVNKDIKLWVKYASDEESPWQFTISESDSNGIQTDMKSKGHTVVVLVCGRTTICCVTMEELSELIDLKAGKAQGIKVDAQPNKQMRITGASLKKDGLKVAHNSFPACIFE